MSPKSLKIVIPIVVLIVGAAAAGVISLGSSRLAPSAGDWTRLVLVAAVYCLVFAASQLAVNRSGLTLIWNGVLGPRGLEWCHKTLPPLVKSILSIPEA